jgi:hypothetical protein
MLESRSEMGKAQKVIVMKSSETKKIWKESAEAYYATMKRRGYDSSEKAPPDEFMRKHCEI